MTATDTQMNCEDYRKAIAADPSERFDGGVVHSAGCESCRRYRDEMRYLDDRIARALAIEVPELDMPELPRVGTDANVVSLPFGGSRPSKAPLWLGIAASLLIVGFLGIRMFGPVPGQRSLSEQVIAHLDHEPQALVVTSMPVSGRVLDAVLSEDGAEMDDEVGLVTYARSCVINGKSVPHLVIQGETGPVTLLLMPDEHVDSAIPLEGEAINGVILPVGDGSIAIIGERDEQLEQIENRVVNSVRWRT